MAEIFLYEAIETNSAKKFIDQLNATKGAVTVRINSGGGSVFEGLAIYNAIKQKGQVKTQIDGLAASIAGLIAMGGSRIEIARNALIMIHNPWAGMSGDSAELRKQAALLDKVKTAMIEAYAGKTGKTTAEISIIMDNETWYTAEEALQHNLVDSIYAPLKLAAHYIGIENFTLPGRILAMTQNTQNAQKHDSDTQAKLDELSAIKAEQARQGGIEAKFKPFLKKYKDIGVSDLMNDCLGDPDISEKQAIELLNKWLGQGLVPTAVHFPCRLDANGYPVDSLQYSNNNHHKDFLMAATDALLLKNNIRPKLLHPSARDVMGMSLTDMARTLLSQSGGTIRRGLFGVKSETSHDVIKAAMTTSDFPLLLENVASKSLMTGYESEPASHRTWVNQTDVADFKLQKRVALSEAPYLEPVLEAGEYKYGSMKEKGEGFALGTFGKIISLTRQMMINDDLNALTKIPNALGRSAARLEADKVYSILTGNPLMADGLALFHASHKNLMTAAALSIASLADARAAMRKQKGLQGAILNIVPRFLIVPAALESEAEQLVATLVDPTKQNATPQHAWIRGLEIVVNARLDEASGVSWYLAADFNQVDTIEVAYLQGQRGAFIDQETNFDTDALKIKCRLDFQAAPIDWLGLIRNPGA